MCPSCWLDEPTNPSSPSSAQSVRGRKPCTTTALLRSSVLLSAHKISTPRWPTPPRTWRTLRKTSSELGWPPRLPGRAVFHLDATIRQVKDIASGALSFRLKTGHRTGCKPRRPTTFRIEGLSQRQRVVLVSALSPSPSQRGVVSC